MTLWRASFATRPLAAGGDRCCHRDRQLGLAEAGLARNERKLAERDTTAPQPLDPLGLHVRRASRDQLGAAADVVRFFETNIHHLKFCGHCAIFSIINASFTSEPISE